MSFFPPLTRQKYGWPEASYAAATATTRRWYHLHGRRPDLDAAYVSREREKEEDGRRWPWLNGTRRPGSGRAAVCTQVMSYKKRERGECYATKSLAVAAVCLLVSPSGAAAETGPQRILFCRMDGWSRRRGHSDDLECPRAGWKWWGGMLSSTTVVKGDRAKGGWGRSTITLLASPVGGGLHIRRLIPSGSGAGAIK